MPNKDKLTLDAEHERELQQALRAVDFQAREMNKRHPMELALFELPNGQKVIGFREVAK